MITFQSFLNPTVNGTFGDIFPLEEFLPLRLKASTNITTL